MKVNLPPKYLIFASQFTLESIIKNICIIAFDAFRKSKNGLDFIKKQYYYRRKDGELYSVDVIQTWLVDLLYKLIKYNYFGNKIISIDETLFLINLFIPDEKSFKGCEYSEIFLTVFAMFGEQYRIETYNYFLDDFVREKYILDVISKKEKEYSINISDEFKQETGYSTDEYSTFIATIWGFCMSQNCIISPSTLNINFKNPMFNNESILNIVNRYSLTIEEIRKSNLKRQVFYSYPFIKIDDEYLSVSPYLLMFWFSNSNYWVMRNLYLKRKSQDFINAFGKYFELYVEEMFHNCLSENDFCRIQEDKQKRADWKLTLFGKDILIEQKSTISNIGIKQNHPDIDAFKNYILKTWKRAALQLLSTEKDLNLKEPIKIILIYEDYYKSECLDELFEIDTALVNDRRYWLVTIRELEMFLMLYKNDAKKAETVFKRKCQAEASHDMNGRGLIKFLEEEKVSRKEYLSKFGIYDMWEKTIDILKK